MLFWFSILCLSLSWLVLFIAFSLFNFNAALSFAFWLFVVLLKVFNFFSSTVIVLMFYFSFLIEHYYCFFHFCIYLFLLMLFFSLSINFFNRFHFLYQGLYIFLGGAHTSICHFFSPSVCLSVRQLRTISQELYIIWSLFLVYICKMMISPGVFSFFQYFDFLGC